MGGSPGDVGEMPVTYVKCLWCMWSKTRRIGEWAVLQVKQQKGWRMRLCSFSNPSGVASPTSEALHHPCLLELIFNPCGEFRWSLESPISQIHSPHLHVGAPGIHTDLLRSVQMLKREWGSESNGAYLSLVKLQPWFPNMQWKICPWAEHSDVDDPIILA